MALARYAENHIFSKKWHIMTVDPKTKGHMKKLWFDGFELLSRPTRWYF